MQHRKSFYLFCNIYNCRLSLKRCSALFINGAKATETFSYITPHIDFSEQIKERHLLEEQLKRRKCCYDLNKIVNLWTVYETLRQRKLEFDKKREEISRELGQLIKNEPDSDAINKYKLQVNLLKDNLKKLKVPLWSAEEAAIIEVLNLPNALHSLTPDEKNKIIHTSHTLPKTLKNHLQEGKFLKILHFNKNDNYYLMSDAAVFELGAKFYFNNILKKNKFVQFSNPDFVKSLIVEGSGQSHTNSDKTFILHHNEDTKINIDNRLHLTGGGSLCSFLAYHAKNVLYPKAFPIKYFAMGRQYVPSQVKEQNLFNVSQSAVVEIFGATKHAVDLDNMLQEIIELVKLAYSQLGYHFQMSIVSADKLSMSESLRISVEMYSTSLNKYIEVANISVSGDFISKRLMFTYTENKKSKFPHLISGTILNVPKLLACVLEHDGDFSVPAQFKIENWSLNPTDH